MKNRKYFVAAACILTAFLLWTLAICFIDVRAIGPEGSAVGFASVNGAIRDLIGVNMHLYTITDWLGLVPFAFVLGFGTLGLVQWIKRKKIWNVDFSILVLGGFYAVTMAIYVLFECVVINYRPVLIGGTLEASYPSSTTMLALCVMPTAMMQLHWRIKHKPFKWCVLVAVGAFAAFMVIGRFLSGVHWFADIVGGTLLSAGLVTLYYAVCKIR